MAAYTKKHGKNDALNPYSRANSEPSPPEAPEIEVVPELRSEATTDDEPVAVKGKLRELTLTARERDPGLRVRVLRRRGLVCEACGFDFVRRYGEFAKYCVEVHHLDPLARADAEGREVAVEDLRVVCPNCHRALHRFGDPPDWDAFRRDCGFA